MSYQSFAKYEMELAGVDDNVQKLVLGVLDVIDGHGHSGASIELYSRMLNRWLGRSQRPGMPDDLKAVLKDSDPETNVNVLMTVHQVIRFEPLSPLTGTDEEWIDQSHPTGSPMFQNRRCTTMFKEGVDGQAYRIGQNVYAYPLSGFKGWREVDRGRDISAQSVVFPYDCHAIENQREVYYYVDEDWEEPLPQGFNPDTWINWMRDRYLKGIDPLTNQVRRDAMFLSLDGCIDFTKDLRAVLCYLKYNWETVTRDYVLQRLDWLVEIEEPFEMRWTEPKAEESGFTGYHVILNDPGRGAALLRMFMLLPASGIDYMVGMEDTLTAPMYIDANHVEYALSFRQVMIADKHYQSWTHNRAYVPVFSATVTVDDFYLHDGHKVMGDSAEFLYQKRRELGLAHPRNRLISNGQATPENVPAMDLTQSGAIGYAPPQKYQKKDIKSKK